MLKRVQRVVMNEDTNRALRWKQMRGMINHPAQQAAGIETGVG
jgi:hypothetical protein